MSFQHQQTCPVQPTLAKVVMELTFLREPIMYETHKIKSQTESLENSIPLTHLATCSVFLLVPTLHSEDAGPAVHCSTKNKKAI